MHDIIQLRGLVHYRKWERRKKNVLIKIMVTKSFDYLLSQFNFFNTFLRKKDTWAYVPGTRVSMW